MQLLILFRLIYTYVLYLCMSMLMHFCIVSMIVHFDFTQWTWNLWLLFYSILYIIQQLSLSLPLSIPFILTLLYIYLIDIESLIAPALEKIHLCFIVFKPYLCIHATHTHSHTLPNNLNTLTDTHTHIKKNTKKKNLVSLLAK